MSAASESAIKQAKAVEEFIYAGLPQAKSSGIKVELASGGLATLRSVFNPKQIRPGGTVSGPTMMALADAAMYAAILGAAIDDDALSGTLENELSPEALALTSDLHCRFLAAPAPKDLIAKAKIIHRGRKNIVLEVEVFSQGVVTPVAWVSGSYILPSKKFLSK